MDATAISDHPILSLSPAGLVKGLKKNSRSVWPSTYQELDSIELLQPVVTWLKQLFIGKNQPETEVVLAFLEVIGRMDFTLRHPEANVLKKLNRIAQDEISALQRELQQHLTQALNGIGAKDWPAGIVSLGQATQSRIEPHRE